MVKFLFFLMIGLCFACKNESNNDMKKISGVLTSKTVDCADESYLDWSKQLVKKVDSLPYVTKAFALDTSIMPELIEHLLKDSLLSPTLQYCDFKIKMIIKRNYYGFEVLHVLSFADSTTARNTFEVMSIAGVSSADYEKCLNIFFIQKNKIFLIDYHSTEELGKSKTLKDIAVFIEKNSGKIYWWSYRWKPE